MRRNKKLNYIKSKLYFWFIIFPMFVIGAIIGEIQLINNRAMFDIDMYSTMIILFPFFMISGSYLFWKHCIKPNKNNIIYGRQITQ